MPHRNDHLQQLRRATTEHDGNRRNRSSGSGHTVPNTALIVQDYCRLWSNREQYLWCVGAFRINE